MAKTNEQDVDAPLDDEFETLDVAVAFAELVNTSAVAPSATDSVDDAHADLKTHAEATDIALEDFFLP